MPENTAASLDDARALVEITRSLTDQAVAHAAEPVLRFRAVAWDYAALAAREADPDTLFFNRRLVVEGDTEIALLVKNTLDTIEIPRTRGFLRRAMRAVGTGKR